MLKVDTNIGGYTKVIDGKVTMVAVEILDLIWPQVLPLLEESQKWWQDYYSLEDIKNACRIGEMQMWVGIEEKKIFIMGLTSICEAPKGRYLKCVFLAGKDFKKILSCIKEIEQWAAMRGAIRSEITGRDAWIELGARMGYTKRSVTVTKQLVAQSSDRRH